MKAKTMRSRAGDLASKATAVAMAAVLACALAPTAAMASVTAGAPPEAAAQPAGLAAQAAKAAGSAKAKKAKKAKKVKVYVLTKTKHKAKRGSTRTITEKFTYNKKGLLAKKVETATDPAAKGVINGWETGKQTWSKKTWEYNKDGTIRKHKVPGAAYSYVYSGGRLEKVAVTKPVEGGGTVKTNMELEYDAAGRLAHVHGTDHGTIDYTYDGKGRVVKTYVNCYPAMSWETKYDSKGNGKEDLYQLIFDEGDEIMGMTWSHGVSKFKYSHGRIVKSTGSSKFYYRDDLHKKETGWRTTKTAPTTYSYKAIKVPASMAAKVRAQQWALFNGDSSFVLGEGGVASWL